MRVDKAASGDCISTDTYSRLIDVVPLSPKIHSRLCLHNPDCRYDPLNIHTAQSRCLDAMAELLAVEYRLPGWNAPFVPRCVWQSKHATRRFGFSDRRSIVSLNCCGNSVSNSRKPSHPFSCIGFVRAITTPLVAVLDRLRILACGRQNFATGNRISM